MIFAHKMCLYTSYDTSSHNIRLKIMKDHVLIPFLFSSFTQLILILMVSLLKSKSENNILPN